jgi:MerR family transcriptional regulator, light-induced transcriptional regulator
MDQEVSAAADGAELKQRLARLIRAGNAAGAIELLTAALGAGQLTIPRIYLTHLGPLLEEVGADWQAGITPVWREHLTSSTVRTIIEALTPAVARESAGLDNTGIVVLACPAEEQHDLGLRMIADLYRLRGWTAYFLGADTPADQIMAAATELNADLIVLSAATHYHRLRLRDLTVSLKQVIPNIAVKVTGAAFSADHDGWADDEVLDPASLTGNPGSA